MKTPTSNKKVQSLEQCSQLQLLKAYSHRFELNYILYQCENLSQGRRAYYFSFLYTLTGITPAYAGKTRPLLHKHENTWDHPRVCGKNSIIAKLVSHVPGSPPRVREKQTLLNFVIRSTGITPACAGKRCSQSVLVAVMWDHPRVCGKNYVCVPYSVCF